MGRSYVDSQKRPSTRMLVFAVDTAVKTLIEIGGPGVAISLASDVSLVCLRKSTKVNRYRVYSSEYVCSLSG